MHALLLCFLHRLDQCLELLIRTNRLPEAAFLARTYLPSQVSRVVKLWRENLAKVNQKVSYVFEIFVLVVKLNQHQFRYLFLVMTCIFIVGG